jgi:hypothetical protein
VGSLVLEFNFAFYGPGWPSQGRPGARLTSPYASAKYLSKASNEISDNCRYHCRQNNKGLGDNTVRHRAVPAATIIVAASLIGISQARLPRPVRGYHDRVTVETLAVACDDRRAPFKRRMLNS